MFTHTTHNTLLFRYTCTCYMLLFTHTHTCAHYYLLTDHSFILSFLQQIIIVAIGLVAEYDFIEDSIGIALKLHNFILTFHCNASLKVEGICLRQTAKFLYSHLNQECNRPQPKVFLIGKAQAICIKFCPDTSKLNVLHKQSVLHCMCIIHIHIGS